MRYLTDTGENFQKWTQVFSTRRWVILVGKKRLENSLSTFDRFCLWSKFESSLVSVNNNASKSELQLVVNLDCQLLLPDGYYGASLMHLLV